MDEFPVYRMDVTQDQTRIQSHTFDSSTCVPYTHARYSYMNGFSERKRIRRKKSHCHSSMGGETFYTQFATHTRTHITEEKESCPWQISRTTPAMFPSNFFSSMPSRRRRRGKAYPRPSHVVIFPSWSLVISVHPCNS
jgi:hypothetical protein